MSRRPVSHVLTKAAYIPLRLREALNEHAQTSSRDRAQIVLDAINTNRDQLRAAFSPASISARDTAQRPVARRRRDGTPRRQVTLNLSPQDTELIDGLVITLGAGSRSALIERALDLQLGSSPQGKGRA